MAYGPRGQPRRSYRGCGPADLLAVVNELEADETLPPAAHFHTVAAFDRVLGLDPAAR